MNERVLQVLPFDQIKSRFEEMGMEGVTPEFWALIQMNIHNFPEVKEWWAICYGPHGFTEENRRLLEVAQHALPLEPWDEATFKTWMNEVREETGLVIEVDHVIGIFPSTYGSGEDAKPILDIAYRCHEIDGGEWAISDESGEARWFALAEFPEPAFAGEQRALAALRAE
mgnify:CR=1 FL=1